MSHYISYVYNWLLISPKSSNLRLSPTIKGHSLGRSSSSVVGDVAEYRAPRSEKFQNSGSGVSKETFRAHQMWVYTFIIFPFRACLYDPGVPGSRLVDNLLLFSRLRYMETGTSRLKQPRSRSSGTNFVHINAISRYTGMKWNEI